MALLDILIYPDPRLHETAKPVAQINDEIRTLIDDMAETMYAAPGIGLAAPQVGASQQVIVVEYAEPPEVEEGEEPVEVTPKLYVMVNPEIVKTSSETEVGVEGCLSV